jgi:hypothetical protein
MPLIARYDDMLLRICEGATTHFIVSFHQPLIVKKSRMLEIDNIYI